MTDKKRNNGIPDPDMKKWLDQFEENQRDQVRKIWNESSRAAPDAPDIGQQEVEQALSDVHRRLDSNNEFPPGANKSAVRFFNWRRIAAAAVLLIAVGLGFLLIPQTHTVPRGEISTMELSDGSQVELNSGSELQYNRLFGLLNRTVHLDGEGYFTVKEGEQTFTVFANRAAVEVTGTEFNVRSWSDDPASETEVSVTEGSVLFFPEHLREVAVGITPGQLSRWKSGMDEPAVPEEVSVERLTGWRDQMLIFNDKTLTAIFSELERRFDVEIRLEDDQLSDQTLTTYYSEPEDVESVLEDICQVKGLRFAPTANGYRIYK